MGKVISLELLDHIIDRYQIPRDIRARKVIEDMSVTVPPATRWHRPAEVTPTHSEAVLVAIDGQLGPHKMLNAYYIAHYIEGHGWALDATDSDMIVFTVKRWAELPDLPDDLAEECRRWLHE